MVKLRDKGTGADLGTISDAELQYIIDQMYEDSPDDTDYHISRDSSTMKPAPIILLEAMGDRDGFEEESSDDTDYYINRTELEILKENGPPGLIRMLEEAIGDREGIEIEWIEE